MKDADAHCKTQPAGTNNKPPARPQRTALPQRNDSRPKASLQRMGMLRRKNQIHTRLPRWKKTVATASCVKMP